MKDQIINTIQQKIESRKQRLQRVKQKAQQITKGHQKVQLPLRETETRLLNAVTQVVSCYGFGKLGVNMVAKEAACDKVLIYRYFGSFENLLEQWALKHDFYVSAYQQFGEEFEQISNLTDLKNALHSMLMTHLQNLRKDKLMQELSLWEFSLSTPYAMVRETREKNAEILKHKIEKHCGKDTVRKYNLDLYLSILMLAIDSIVLYTRKVSQINGVDFAKDEAWLRLEKLIPDYINMIFNQLNTEENPCV
ncbi:MAG: TetR/AcrR family transcriptional regulator [Bacteroidales bacterium]